MTTTQKKPKKIQKRIVSLLTIVIIILLGIWLDLTRPIWLKPPLFIYMPIMYALLPLAWLPVLAISTRFRLISGLSRLLIGIVFLIGNCFWFTLTAPRLMPELPYLGVNGELSCHSTALPQTPSDYTCENHIESSDGEYVVIYEFELLDNLPFMLLKEQKQILTR